MPHYPECNFAPFTVDRINPKKILKTLQTWGIVVITDVYSKEQCQEFMCDFVPKNMEIIKNMPTVKPGQHKNIIANDPMVWKFRKDQRLEALNSYLHKKLNDYPTYPHMIPSVDAVNIKDPLHGPYSDPNKPDWAHLDQTNGNIHECIQGQIVLTNTTAGFVSSPKSHLIYHDIMKIMHVGQNDKSNWCILSERMNIEQEAIIKQKLNDIGGSWQEVIHAPAGSVILWFSSVIHSAKTVDKPLIKITPKNAEKEKMKRLENIEGWRGIIYLCYLPSFQLTEHQKENRRKAMLNNQTMNHRCENIWNRTNASGDMGKLLENPSSWKFFNKSSIETIIENEKKEENNPDTYHKKITDILEKNK